MVNNVVFCIQTLPHDNSGFSLPSPDSAVLLEVIDEHNWLHPEDPIAAMLSSSCADIFQDGEQLIPVGSIEFVESGLRRWYGIERGLTPLFIPEQLRPFANRWVQVAHGKRQVESAIANLGKAFIKSASAVKCDYAGIYHTGQKLPDIQTTSFHKLSTSFQNGAYLSIEATFSTLKIIPATRGKCLTGPP